MGHLLMRITTKSLRSLSYGQIGEKIRFQRMSIGLFWERHFLLFVPTKIRFAFDSTKSMRFVVRQTDLFLLIDNNWFVGLFKDFSMNWFDMKDILICGVNNTHLSSQKISIWFPIDLNVKMSDITGTLKSFELTMNSIWTKNIHWNQSVIDEDSFEKQRISIELKSYINTGEKQLQEKFIWFFSLILFDFIKEWIHFSNHCKEKGNKSILFISCPTFDWNKWTSFIVLPLRSTLDQRQSNDNSFLYSIHWQSIKWWRRHFSMNNYLITNSCPPSFPQGQNIHFFSILWLISMEISLDLDLYDSIEQRNQMNWDNKFLFISSSDDRIDHSISFEGIVQWNALWGQTEDWSTLTQMCPHLLSKFNSMKKFIDIGIN